jgi:hypothetical protein
MPPGSWLLNSQSEIRNPDPMLYALRSMLNFMLYAPCSSPFALRCALCAMRRAQQLIPVITLVAIVIMLSPGIGSTDIRTTLTPRISIQEQYDDNIDLKPDSEDSDWITTVSPGFLLELQSQKTTLELDYEAGFAFYAKDSARDTNRHRARFLWGQDLSPYLSLRVADTFSRSEDPITISEEGRVVDIASEREVQYRNRGEARLDWQFGPEDLLSFGYRHLLLNSNADGTEDSRANEGLVDLATWFVPQFGIGLTSSFSRWEFQQPSGFTDIPTEDFYQYQAGLTTNYRWRPTSLIFARYSILGIDFDNETSAISDDYLVHQSTLGLSLRFSPNTELGAEVGYFRQDIENGNGEDGFVLNANFNTRGQRTSLRIWSNTGYNLDYGSSDNQGFSKSSSNSANISYQLTDDFNVFASARYRWQDFTEIDRSEHTYGGSAGLAFGFWRWLTLSLEGAHLRRDSNDAARDFDDNRVTLRITAAYPWQISQ